MSSAKESAKPVSLQPKEKQAESRQSDAPVVEGTDEKADDQDEAWEKVEYAETEEGRAPTDVSSGHFGIKIGTKRWNKTIYSVDWSTRRYEDNGAPPAEGGQDSPQQEKKVP